VLIFSTDNPNPKGSSFVARRPPTFILPIFSLFPQEEREKSATYNQCAPFLRNRKKVEQARRFSLTNAPMPYIPRDEATR